VVGDVERLDPGNRHRIDENQLVLVVGDLEVAAGHVVVIIGVSTPVGWIRVDPDVCRARKLP